LGFAGLEIARSGMYVNERALSVTGHNVANVNTKGYARQQAMITTGPYLNLMRYQIGLGASIQETRQIRHLFLIISTEMKTPSWDTGDKKQDLPGNSDHSW